MRVLQKEDVVGRRILDVIVSEPDKPVTMSTMSYSPGYLRLDNGVLFHLGQPTEPALHASDESALTGLTRDTRYEREFRPLLGQQIEDVVLMVDDGCLCVVTKDFVITEVPAQFWVRPCIYKRADLSFKTEPYWKEQSSKGFEWRLHIPTEDNRITHYQCGLIAGQRVRLKKDLVVTCDGVPTGAVHRSGEEWIVLTGITTDPVLWLRQPDGERCTWDDDAASVDEWFERIS